MLRIYRRFWQVNWAEQWQYRANLLMYLLYWLVSPIVYLVGVDDGGQQPGQRPGADRERLRHLLPDAAGRRPAHQRHHDPHPGYKIQDGTLSGELLRPVHPILTNTLINNLAFKALTFMRLHPGLAGAVLLFQPDFSGGDVAVVLLALPGLCVGFGISFLLGATITCLAFWTTRVYSLREFYYALAVLFSGQFVPLELMPPVIQQIAQFLPFQLMIYFPIQLILGRLPPDAILRNFALGLVWLADRLGLFRWVWRRGVKRFSAVGA